MEIALKLLEIVAALAPGLLSAMAGTESDADAIAKARAELAKVAPTPARDGVEAHRRPR